MSVHATTHLLKWTTKKRSTSIELQCLPGVALIRLHTQRGAPVNEIGAKEFPDED
jgi:hypothetical protein